MTGRKIFLDMEYYYVETMTMFSNQNKKGRVEV